MSAPAAAKALATKNARAAATGYRPDDTITTHTHDTRWSHRAGRVVTTSLGEIGVSFTGTDSVDAWFLPTELTRAAA